MDIITSRLRLRRWSRHDIVPFSLINEDPRVMRFMPRTMSMAETREWINVIEAHFEEHGYGVWAVERLDSQKLIGFTGIQVPRYAAAFTPCVEVGWRFAFEAWGNGFATEAAHAALEYGFCKAGLREILSFTVPANEKSWRVMERIGMRRDEKADFHHPVLPQGHPLSFHYLYRIGKDEWLQRCNPRATQQSEIP
ncbi:GNAT family N-acetyltransferase [Verrucomicrobia bacterium LW23]|nr:GNAT family N-acetyltransferase [Verrucomicrobia bacterium LW23]